MSIRGSQGAYWVLDRQTGKKVLVTPDTQALYSRIRRYVRLYNEPVPTDTQEIIKISEAQTKIGLEQGDFDEDDLAFAADRGMSARRRFKMQQQKLKADPTPKPSMEAMVDVSEDAATLAETTEPSVPKKKAAKKKATKKAE